MGSWTELPHSVMVVYHVTFIVVGGEAEPTEDTLDVAISAVEESASGGNMSLELWEGILEPGIEGL
jgi:hypothetical protein